MTSCIDGCLGYIIIIIAIIILAWNLFISPLVEPIRKSKFAKYYLSITTDGTFVSDPMRKKLLEDLHEYKKSLGRSLKILEIGAGYGANLPFFPEGSEVLCTDPNPEWKKYFPEFVQKNPHIHVEQMVVGPAENLSMIPDASVDVIVSTFVLCSVQDVDASIKEAKRILRPGGKFYFLEHVQADTEVGGTLLWLVQKLVKYQWAFLLDQCTIDRKIWKNLEHGGFSKLEMKRKRMYWGGPALYPMSVGVIGTATK